jgi:hypothetical protein
LCFVTGSWYKDQIGLELTLQPRLTSTCSPFFCFSLSSARNTGTYHHAQQDFLLEIEFGIFIVMSI